MAYTRVDWEDSPSSNTPVNAANLNIMDAAIKSVSDATDITVTNPSSQTRYQIPFVSGTSGKATQRVNDGIRYDTQNTGRATLLLGNDTSTSSTGGKEGVLALHNSSTGYTWLKGTASSSAFTQTLPALSGTVCVKQSATITTETNGWYVVNMGAFVLYYKNGTTESATYSANTWGTKLFDLPSGITFNSSTMAFVGDCVAVDAALRASIAVGNGATKFTISWLNHSTQSFSTTIPYNAILIKFS